MLAWIVWIAGGIGAACGALAGFVGAALLWWLAELGCRRRALLTAAALLGVGLGWFVLDLAAAIGAAPDDDSTAELLVWRVGTAVTGAVGAAWQVVRTAEGRPNRVG